MTTPGLKRLTELRRKMAAVLAGTQELTGVRFAELAETPPYEHGLAYYKDGVLNVMAEFEDVILQVGEELQLPVVNKESPAATIYNGQPVFMKGAQGQRLAVGLADSADPATELVVGLATHDIPTNQNGRVTFVGAVRDLDTSAWPIGSILYVDGLGTLTDVKPTAAGTYAAQVGVVTSSHPVNGVIHVHAPRLQSTIAFPTASRPATGVRVGTAIFDTTLGRPVWWTGSGWVDATGGAA